MILKTKGPVNTFDLEASTQDRALDKARARARDWLDGAKDIVGCVSLKLVGVRVGIVPHWQEDDSETIYSFEVWVE